jgi:phosphoserine phosphatase
MNSTLINIECIDEIARECGKVNEVSKITEATMRGEIKNFSESLIARVKILQGASASSLENVYRNKLRLNPGAQSLIEYAKENSIKTLLVSGGFTFFSDKVKNLLNLDEAHSNTLEINNGILTGQVLGQIVDGECKARLVKEFCLKHNVPTSAAMVFGDGSNDLPMMETAGISIGYKPKPIIKEKADGTLNFVGLDGVIDLLKYYA